jgi:DNA topoisomerase-1
MRLLIVESPAKAKTINRYLDNEYTVRASVGHIRDLPKSNKKAVDIENGFKPHYEISKGKENVVADLKKLAKKASEVVLATDLDREGEAIAWHLLETLDIPAKKAKRVTYSEITKEAILEALKHPRKIDNNLRRAQEARRVLDRLVGYDLSGIIWKKVRYGLSAGRVQSPALRIIVEREKEIRAFVPEKFWVINAVLKNTNGTEIDFVCSIEPKTESDAKEIVEIGSKATWKIKAVEESEAKRSPRPPFTTSTLQQAASSRLGFSPSRTMGIAQKLYESGYITYMRTDSTNLSESALAEIYSVVTSEYGKEYLSPRKYAAKSKNAQEAHEAIRPSHASKLSAGHTDEQKKLYKLIWQRAVASQMSDAKLSRTRALAETDKEKIPPFQANGSRIIFPGWLKADPESRGEENELPKMTQGETMTLVSIESTGKETEPPGRYTEAGLVKELEKRGIGRPSTYASIITTIEKRGYVTKEGRSLKPTDTGEVVSDFLETNFNSYISDNFTAEMEDNLDKIADGSLSYEKTLGSFYKPFVKEIKAKSKLEKATNLGDADPKWKCPKCGSPMIIKLSKNGRFMSCSRFPECTGARTIEGVELEGPKETGEKCPLDGGNLIERDGRFGRFVACANYPKCKYIKKDANLANQNTTGVKCPVCKKGEMVERRGRFGLFYSCSNYPDCKNAIKAKPTGNICSMCGSLMMEGTKTIPERCSNKACANHRPDKLK